MRLFHVETQRVNAIENETVENRLTKNVHECIRCVVLIRVDSSGSVDHHKDPHDCRYNEHLRIEPEPAKVESNLVSIVTLDQGERLALVPPSESGPFLVQDLEKLFSTDC